MKPQNTSQLIHLIQDLTGLNRLEIAKECKMTLFFLNGLQTGDLMPQRKNIQNLARMAKLEPKDLKHCFTKNIVNHAQKKYSYLWD